MRLAVLVSLSILVGCEQPKPLGLALEGASARAPHGRVRMVAVPGTVLEVVDPHGARRLVEVAAFEIDRTEVTVRNYRRCLAAGRCRPHWSALAGDCNLMDPDRADHPMNCVRREDAAAYCAWLGKRLPTMAEWQLAASGGTRAHPWGDASEEGGYACWRGRETCAVGAHPRGATPTGIQDLAGNVWEISEEVCAVEPPRPELCGRYTVAVHGGSFASCEPHDVSCDNEAAITRMALADEVPHHTVGFRCVK